MPVVRGEIIYGSTDAYIVNANEYKTPIPELLEERMVVYFVGNVNVELHDHVRRQHGAGVETDGEVLFTIAREVMFTVNALLHLRIHGALLGFNETLLDRCTGDGDHSCQEPEYSGVWVHG